MDINNYLNDEETSNFNNFIVCLSERKVCIVKVLNEQSKKTELYMCHITYGDDGAISDVHPYAKVLAKDEAVNFVYKRKFSELN